MRKVGVVATAVGFWLFLAQTGLAQTQGPTSIPPPTAARDCATPLSESDVVVCGRREGRSPLRLPETDQGFDPAGTIDSVSRERHRLLDLGAAGIQSCSTVGPGGWTGCDLIRWREAQEQYGGAARSGERGVSIQVGPLRPSGLD